MMARVPSCPGAATCGTSRRRSGTWCVMQRARASNSPCDRWPALSCLRVEVTESMPVSITDSLIYGSAWGTEEMRSIFDDVPRTQAWLEVLAALAQEQARLGLIPQSAADEIARKADVRQLDFDNIRRGYHETSHSTLGLIRELQRVLSPQAGEWVYFGATVQDITDTWTSLALKRVAEIAYRDLRALEACL